MSCILDSTINGRIDQVSGSEGIVMLPFLTNWILKVTGVLELDKNNEDTARYTALDKWNTQLNNLQKLVINKMS